MPQATLMGSIAEKVARFEAVLMRGGQPSEVLNVKNDHPYHPLHLDLPGYEQPVLPFEHVLGYFFGASFIILLAVWCLSGLQKQLSVGERLSVAWFALTGIIHFVVEGAVVMNAEFYKDKTGNIFSEIWKEYAKADSRYATRDPFVISMETVTAFVEGPLCFVVVYATLRRKPWRYVMQLAVSFGQLYGDILYFATSYLEGGISTRPEPLYFWFYFLFINSIWVVIPLLVVVYASRRIVTAVSFSERNTPSVKLE